MFLQHNNYGFSAPVVFRSRVAALGKGTAIVCALRLAAKHHRSALRVSLSRSTDCVAPLARGTANVCVARLAVNLDKLTELAIIMLKEH